VGYAYLHYVTVLFGAHHPAVTKFALLLSVIQDLALTDLLLTLSSAYGCAQLMRSIQLANHVWAAQQVMTDQKGFPDYAHIIREMHQGSYSGPLLPTLWFSHKQLAPYQYLQQPAFPNLPPRGSATSAVPQPRPGAVLQPGPVAALQPQREKPVDIFQPESHRVPGVYNKDINLGLLLGMGRPLAYPGTTTIPCLRYHVKGRCIDKCQLIVDHRSHTPDLSAHIKAYLANKL
jgi:hypothetical protein